MSSNRAEAALAAWPAVTYEQHPWSSRYAPGAGSRTQLRKHQGPYLAAVPVEIAERALPMSAETLALVSDATNEVSRFDAELGGEIAPFSAVAAF